MASSREKKTISSAGGRGRGGGSGEEGEGRGGEGVSNCSLGSPISCSHPATLSVKMGLILRSIEQRLQIQFSMARKFLLRPIMQILHLQYDVKPCEKTA